MSDLHAGNVARLIIESGYSINLEPSFVTDEVKITATGKGNRYTKVIRRWHLDGSGVLLRALSELQVEIDGGWEFMGVDSNYSRIFVMKKYTPFTFTMVVPANIPSSTKITAKFMESEVYSHERDGQMWYNEKDIENDILPHAKSAIMGYLS